MDRIPFGHDYWHPGWYVVTPFSCIRGICHHGGDYPGGSRRRVPQRSVEDQSFP